MKQAHAYAYQILLEILLISVFNHFVVQTKCLMSAKIDVYVEMVFYFQEINACLNVQETLLMLFYTHRSRKRQSIDNCH